MQTRSEFEKVFETLQRHALERKLAEPMVSFALHAVDCHADMLAALKAALAHVDDDMNNRPVVLWKLREIVVTAIAKAEAGYSALPPEGERS
jgi:hypothetical protein